MLGNDIVDLSLASIQSNWRRRGFLNKIFNHAEQKLILSSSLPDVLVWRLWTLKESAYKIFNRQTGIRTFEPAKISCEIDGNLDGRVSIQDNVFFTKSRTTLNYVYTIAALNHSDLDKGISNIYRGNAKEFDYHAQNPQSISHHGDYLALVDFA